MSIAKYEVVELLPRMKPRVLTLGECFILELAKVPNGRGLAAAYERIESVIGGVYGTRNTFGKLQRAQSYESLNKKDRARAWILMATLGMNPAEFGASDEGAPPRVNIESLRADLLLPEVDSNHQPAGLRLALITSLCEREAKGFQIKTMSKRRTDSLAPVTQISASR